MRQNGQKKREWKKPELRILVKSESEESVLSGCKVWEQSFLDGPGGVTCKWYSGWFCSQETTS